MNLLQMMLSWFSKPEPPPPRGALCYFAQATGSQELFVEEPVGTRVSVNDQVHGRWNTRVEYLVVERSFVGNRWILRAQTRKVGYLPADLCARARDLKARVDHATPGMLWPGHYYLCEYVSGRVNSGGSAAWGY
jgi:hypothetical protein